MRQLSDKPNQILMTEAAYRRTGARLHALAGEFDPLLIDAFGTLRRSDVSAPSVETQPTIAWAGADVFIDGLFPVLAQAALESENLRWFQSGAAGTDHPVFAQLMRRAVRVTISHAPSNAVADFVMNGVLDHLRRGPARREGRSLKQWSPLPFTEIAGSNWLIIGFGAIGQGVAKRARAFGAHITGIRRTRSPHELADALEPPEALASVLPGADIVVLAAPLTRATHHMVNKDFFAQMKHGALLVNVGRGGLVDEAALLHALAMGQLAHAVLDVSSVEPLPEEHPFWLHPQIALTPHIAGMGSGVVPRGDDLFLENLARFLKGAPLLHEVDAGRMLEA
jgi:phosphoglycerate dehydrogenase-like enzyme